MMEVTIAVHAAHKRMSSAVAEQVQVEHVPAFTSTLPVFVGCMICICDLS